MRPALLKKGWTDEQVAAIIIILFVAIIMVVWFGAVQSKATRLASNELCAKTVQLHGQTNQKLTWMGTSLADKLGKQVELQCYTSYEKVLANSPEQAKKKIAESMVECWDMFGNGNVELFDTKDGNYCVVCSQLTFAGQEKLAGLSSYLIQESPQGSKETYYEILTNQEPDQQELLGGYRQKMQDLDEISLKEPLAVMFVMYKDAYPDAVIIEEGKLSATVKGTGIGVLTGAVVNLVGFIAVGSGVLAPVGIGILAAATGTVGYMMGATQTADCYDSNKVRCNSGILLWNYNQIDKLGCTVLEGSAGKLESVTYIKK